MIMTPIVFSNNTSALLSVEVDNHLKLFQSLKPSLFKGEVDARTIEDWLIRIEKDPE
ncbi:hypothetical protein KFK09_026293 [Dendrobium nobile]|uniref:Uncharacterized protein n=1 Tax=Dendrobium nobile TaxID=94219 RepID=A0A8T3A7D3_DENNO|nr:hypothetical protein KFK09_026293 [Dendrobium nobile]